MPVESTNDSSEMHPPASVPVPDGGGDGSAVSSRTLTFRKFRELLMVKQFSERDNIPTPVLPDRLFIGSLGAASNREGLDAAGITHILCVASSLPILFPEHYVCERLPLADVPTARLDDVLPAGIAFIDRALTEGGRVLVHCYVGRSRSASMVLAYLICRNGMTLEDAMQLLKRVRPQVQPNSGFMAQLRSLESQQASESMERNAATEKVDKEVKNSAR